ncbi:antA/AntB antirepressor family protein [Delftia tsuruhatensis]|uniref:antA/AntB antirepressor family protein n=1 Tax=Delftia tsuruhatensis TaxID=180282 RepID=UPI002449B41A|nr:antA/AntB antirepressor family protein [Delftia tsuruhatensis]MDH2234561.1 antA/AntB antirepressor family protein [Delftia tsuruhatensis]
MAGTTTLVPIFPGTLAHRTVQLCDARALHAFMQVKRDFTTWIKGRIHKFGFVAGEDFITVENLSSPDLGNSKSRAQKLTDYHLTMDMAKELSMVENNDQGRAARRYFIECERRSKSARPGITAAQAKAAQAQIEAMRKQLAKVEAQMAEWVVVDDTPPPKPALRALVNEVGRYQDGSWGLNISCGDVSFSLQVDNAVMRAGGVKAGDEVRIEHEKGQALRGPYTRVYLQSEYQAAIH